MSCSRATEERLRQMLLAGKRLIDISVALDLPYGSVEQYKRRHRAELMEAKGCRLDGTPKPGEVEKAVAHHKEEKEMENEKTVTGTTESKAEEPVEEILEPFEDWAEARVKKLKAVVKMMIDDDASITETALKLAEIKVIRKAEKDIGHAFEAPEE